MALKFFLNQTRYYPYEQALANQIGTLAFQWVYIPDSISFNNVSMMYRASGSTAKSLTASFGLYSLTGSTLTLINSASGSVAPVNGAFTSWMSLATSATSNIIEGEYYFAHIISSAGASTVEVPQVAAGAFNVVTGGSTGAASVFHATYSVTTGAFPASVNVTDTVRIGQTNSTTRVYMVLISA